MLSFCLVRVLMLLDLIINYSIFGKYKFLAALLQLTTHNFNRDLVLTKMPSFISILYTVSPLMCTHKNTSIRTFLYTMIPLPP